MTDIMNVIVLDCLVWVEKLLKVRSENLRQYLVKSRVVCADKTKL